MIRYSRGLVQIELVSVAFHREENVIFCRASIDACLGPVVSDTVDKKLSMVSRRLACRDRTLVTTGLGRGDRAPSATNTYNQNGVIVSYTPRNPFKIWIFVGNRDVSKPAP